MGWVSLLGEGLHQVYYILRGCSKIDSKYLNVSLQYGPQVTSWQPSLLPVFKSYFYGFSNGFMVGRIGDRNLLTTMKAVFTSR